MKKLLGLFILTVTMGAPLYAAEIKEGADEKAKNDLNMTLAQAIYRLDVAGVSKALKQGANPDARFVFSPFPDPTIRFPNPTMFDVPCLFILLGKTFGQRSISPLMQNEMLSVLSILTDYNVNINAINNPTDQNKSPLLHVCSFSNSDNYLFLIKALVDKGANINQQDSDGATSLMRAALEGATATFKFLLESNANTTIRDRAGNDLVWFINHSWAKKDELLKIFNDFIKQRRQFVQKEAESYITRNPAELVADYFIEEDPETKAVREKKYKEQTEKEEEE